MALGFIRQRAKPQQFLPDESGVPVGGALPSLGGGVQMRPVNSGVDTRLPQRFAWEFYPGARSAVWSYGPEFAPTAVGENEVDEEESGCRS